MATLKRKAPLVVADAKQKEAKWQVSREMAENVNLMRSIILFLDTQSWKDSSDDESTGSDSRLSEIKSSLVSISETFRAPLETKGVVLNSILDEMEDIVDYARIYLRLGCDNYSQGLASAVHSTRFSKLA